MGIQTGALSPRPVDVRVHRGDLALAITEAGARGEVTLSCLKVLDLAEKKIPGHNRLDDLSLSPASLLPVDRAKRNSAPSFKSSTARPCGAGLSVEEVENFPDDGGLRVELPRRDRGDAGLPHHPPAAQNIRSWKRYYDTIFNPFVTDVFVTFALEGLNMDLKMMDELRLLFSFAKKELEREFKIKVHHGARLISLHALRSLRSSESLPPMIPELLVRALGSACRFSKRTRAIVCGSVTYDCGWEYIFRNFLFCSSLRKSLRFVLRA